jgi:hypothetical protein
MKSIKKTITLLIFLLSSFTGFSQTNKDVTITSSGRGKTQENAKQAALRSAIEQAFGAFISSKTEMFNDQIVADQMSSVSSGNIKSYELLNESQLPDSSWGVTIKAVVSVDKLTSFVEAKGVAIEIKGGMFVLNIKQQLLNEEGEIKAVNDMVGLLHEPMQTSFDYIIKSSEPKSLDAESKNWEIPLEVKATANKNIDFCANYCMKTLGAISLSSDEVTSYQSLNKAVFPIVVNYNGVAKTFYLRKESSLNALKMFISFWEYYARSFIVQSGVDKLYGNDQKVKDKSVSQGTSAIDINFLTTADIAATFTWNDKKTLSQMEQMNGYTIKSSGVVSRFKHGGFVVYEENGHGLVVANADLGEMNWNAANTASEALIFNGYSDWRLPTKEELNLLYVNMAKLGIGCFRGVYWSSDSYSDYHKWTQNFFNGSQHAELKDESSLEYFVRAVRTF